MVLICAYCGRDIDEQENMSPSGINAMCEDCYLGIERDGEEWVF